MARRALSGGRRGGGGGRAQGDADGSPQPEIPSLDAGIPARTLKRRFKAATGLALIDYVQNLRIEDAKRLLESSAQAAEEISAEVGYDDASFFRRLFRRRTGLSPRQYRRSFRAATLG